MKRLFAWVDCYGCPQGKIRIGKWHLSSVEPHEGVVLGLISFNVSRADTMENIKNYLKSKIQQYDDCNKATKERATTRAIGSARALIQSYYKNEKIYNSIGRGIRLGDLCR
ncbi:MAG: hypothetical protein IK117_04595 [Bacteroidales bacterium]|nr:hypothetical protein [Bacteroidales bacterium]